MRKQLAFILFIGITLGQYKLNQNCSKKDSIITSLQEQNKYIVNTYREDIHKIRKFMLSEQAESIELLEEIQNLKKENKELKGALFTSKEQIANLYDSNEDAMKNANQDQALYLLISFLKSVTTSENFYSLNNKCPIDESMMIRRSGLKQEFGKFLIQYECSFGHVNWIVQ